MAGSYLYANADPANMIDPTGNFSLGSIGVSLNIRGILSISVSRVFLRAGGKQGLKKILGRPKWKIWSAKSFKGIPHSYVYAERLKFGKGTGTGIRFDLGAFSKKAALTKPFTPTSGFIAKQAVRKRGLFLVFSAAKLTHVQFIAWQQSVLGTNLSCGSLTKTTYKLSSNNCFTWTRAALAKAKAIEKIKTMIP